MNKEQNLNNAETQQLNIASVSGMLLLQVKELFVKLTNDERMEVMSDYCTYCGCDDSGCQCWNDD
jgi:hypothetical protein